MSIYDPNKTGKDNRFNAAHRIGRVAEIVSDTTQTSARVVFPDKGNLVSKPLPILQPSGGARRSYNVPKVGQSVLVGTLSNGDSDGFIIGTFYTTQDPPPIADPLRQYTEFADGTTVEFNEATSTMAINAKGPINIVTSGPVTIQAEKIQIVGDVEINGDLKVVGEITGTKNIRCTDTLYDRRGANHN